MELLVEFAFVVAMGDIFVIYIAVSVFQLTIYGGFVDGTRTNIVGECAEKDCIIHPHVLV